MRPRDMTADFWPGFVDALGTLVLVFMLLMTIYVLSANVQNQLTAGDGGGSEVRAQVAELTELLTTKRREAELLEEERDKLQVALDALQAGAAALEREGPPSPGEEGSLPEQLSEQRRISAVAQNELELQNRQLISLQRQIESLQQALDAAEEADRENKTTIADMSRRMNAAMARNAQDTSQYRVEFLSGLRDILGDNDNMGSQRNRYVIQAETLFEPGLATLKPAARADLLKLGMVINRLEEEIPEGANWIVRIDGHTDTRDLRGDRFQSNLHLSSSRAIAVVDFLMENGVSPGRLAATGFGEHLPVDDGTTQAAYRRNRRIEFKLAER